MPNVLKRVIEAFRIRRLPVNVPYAEVARRIPWASRGRASIAAQVGMGLYPIGRLPFEPRVLKRGDVLGISREHPDFEKYLMQIVGTTIQAGPGKLVTCMHVIKLLLSKENRIQGNVLAALEIPSAKGITYVPYKVDAAVGYKDPRTERANDAVDLAVLFWAPRSTDDFPIEVPTLRWKDSSGLGVGDRVVIGGYPLGTTLFLAMASNRGVIQPTFYEGIISAIYPATKLTETRLLQISVTTYGGMSGGAVFLPETGEIVGMVTSGLENRETGHVHPMTFAIPSEVIIPHVRSLRAEYGPGSE